MGRRRSRRPARSRSRRSRRRPAGIALERPEGLVTIDGENQHIYKTARIGVVQPDGLIKEVWNSGKPIKPDPYLKGYPWASGLAQGVMEALVNQLPIGLSIGAVLLLIALGLTFTFGQMGVINMAHGEFIMAGAYTAYLLAGPRWPDGRASRCRWRSWSRG